VEGIIDQKEGEISLHLINAPQNKVKVVKKESSHSRLATLSFQTLSQKHLSFPECTFVRIFPQTGRKHQIRVLFAHQKHAIIGDRKYGCRIPLKSGRIALYAQSLEFNHPISKERKIIERHPPKEWPKKWVIS